MEAKENIFLVQKHGLGAKFKRERMTAAAAVSRKI
jgi:hypothetical protein